MNEAYSQLPIPLMIGMMLFGITVVLIACMPTAWVDRVYRALRKRFNPPSAQ
jgi:hypothetical protein